MTLERGGWGGGGLGGPQIAALFPVLLATRTHVVPMTCEGLGCSFLRL